MSGIHFGDHQEQIPGNRFMNTSDINGPQFKSQMRRRNLSAAHSGAQILGNNPAGSNQKLKKESFQDIWKKGHGEKYDQVQSKQERNPLHVNDFTGQKKPIVPIPDQSQNVKADRMDAKLRATSQNFSNVFGHYKQASQFEEYPQHMKSQNPSQIPPGSRGSQATRISQKTHGKVKPPKVPSKIEGVSITQDATMMDYDQFGQNIVNPTDINQYQVPKRIDDTRQEYIQGASATKIFGKEEDYVPKNVQPNFGKKVFAPKTSDDNMFSNPQF